MVSCATICKTQCFFWPKSIYSFFYLLIYFLQHTCDLQTGTCLLLCCIISDNTGSLWEQMRIDWCSFKSNVLRSLHDFNCCFSFFFTLSCFCTTVNLIFLGVIWTSNAIEKHTMTNKIYFISKLGSILKILNVK